MRRIRNIIIYALLTLFCLHETPVFASTTQSTGYTVTYTINQKFEIGQDAYLPSGAFLDLGLKEPQDLYIADDKMYIADKGNKRILVVDLHTNTVTVVGEGILEEPTGVAADNEGRIYVADFGKAEAYRFDGNGNLEFTFTKPETPNFGKNSSFRPKKVAAADDGGVYLVSEGSTAGIVHMNSSGDFLGYFASNEVNVSFFQRLQDLFLTAEQKKAFLNRTPPSFGNIFRGSDGLIYTTNMGKGVYVKKHSISGLDLFENSDSRIMLNDPADMCVTEDGRIYVLEASGSISEITYDGYLIARFGGNSDKTDRIGLFEVPRGIGVDSESNVYVLDEQKAFVQVFSPTPVQSGIHEALDDYNNGRYEESKRIWKEVLKFNNTSFLAHLYMGRTYMQEENYEEALEHFRIAKVKSYYSTAYWEIRNAWLQKNLGYVLVLLLLMYIIFSLLKLIDREKRIFRFFRNVGHKVMSNRLVYDMLSIKYAMLHPIDNAYNVKHGHTGTYLSASLIYILFFVILVLYQVAGGFIFSVDIADYSLFNTLVTYIVVVGLFIGGNYFISSINDGNGSVRDIYVGTAYCLSPAVVIMPPVILFSNFATLNEQFLINTATTAVIAWCIINIVLMIIEIHEYSFKFTVFNILMTLFSMGVAVLAASMGYLLLNQLWVFIREIVVEVLLRVKAG